MKNQTTQSTNITVISSLCGKGKTSYAIQMMNDSDTQEDNYIYITPFLNEVKRVKQSVSKRRFYEPNYSKDHKTKLDSLKQLVIDGKDIVSTHALFKTVDEELINLIKLRNYTLVLDEVMDITENLTLSKRDWDMLLNEELICIDKADNKIIWLEDDYVGRFSEVKQLANSNNLYLHTRSSKDEDKVKLLVWCFPIEIFKSFNQVYILTYLFEGQFQRYYYDMYKVKYNYKSVMLDREINKYKLVDYDVKLDEREKLIPLIHIYEGNLNKIGDEDYSLSSTWLKKGLKNKNIDALRNNTHNFFQNIIKGKSADNMWTTIKGTEDKRDNIRLGLKYKGYSKGFIPCNARATNEYQHKSNLAYLWNVFINPVDKGFFQDKGVEINEDLYSISEFIQWMYRSRIRKEQDINLYIPSLRMRELLYKWLEYKL
jgi:hypothetical protein